MSAEGIEYPTEHNGAKARRAYCASFISGGRPGVSGTLAKAVFHINTDERLMSIELRSLDVHERYRISNGSKYAKICTEGEHDAT